MQPATYSSAVFNVPNLEAAKRIILTDEALLNTEQRWKRETPYLLSLLEPLGLNAESVVLDYGCGVGRLSREIIGAYGCRVVGVDIAPNMRALAASYVADDKFLACSPAWLNGLGIKFDAAISIWVLQHCFKPHEDIERIYNSLNQGGQLFVVNELNRAVPTQEYGWVHDGLDIRDMLGSKFVAGDYGKLDPAVVSQVQSERTFWAMYRK